MSELPPQVDGEGIAGQILITDESFIIEKQLDKIREDE